MSSARADRGVAWRAGRWVGRVARGAGKVLRGTAALARGSERRDPDLERCYANLELPYGSDLDAVHRARKRLLSRYHPDRFARDPDAARRAAELTVALNQAHAELVRRLSR